MSIKLTINEYIEDIMDELNKRFDLSSSDIEDIIIKHMDIIENEFNNSNGFTDVVKLIDSFNLNFRS